MWFFKLLLLFTLQNHWIPEQDQNTDIFHDRFSDKEKTGEEEEDEEELAA
jgi:hypothetical protein